MNPPIGYLNGLCTYLLTTLHLLMGGEGVMGGEGRVYLAFEKYLKKEITDRVDTTVLLRCQISGVGQLLKIWSLVGVEGGGGGAFSRRMMGVKMLQIWHGKVKNKEWVGNVKKYVGCVAVY